MTITTANPHNLVVGQEFKIVGAPNAPYNGTYTVSAVPAVPVDANSNTNEPTTFQYRTTISPGRVSDTDREHRLRDRGPQSGQSDGRSR